MAYFMILNNSEYWLAMGWRTKNSVPDRCTDFPFGPTFRPALCLILPSIQRTPKALYPVKDGLQSKGNHSCPLGVNVMNAWSCTSTVLRS